MVKTLVSSAGGVGLLSGWESTIPQVEVVV